MILSGKIEESFKVFFITISCNVIKINQCRIKTCIRLKTLETSKYKVALNAEGSQSTTLWDKIFLSVLICELAN